MESCFLRADSKNRRFARNRGLPFYGQISKIDVLPVTESWLLRANPKNRLFARNRKLGFTGRFQKLTFCP
ncbi:Hypothetical protein LRC_18070 [Ligilactobacillus ruminis ATCC 27782]|uniref:Uncharacterized protein n=1 Tax=Ligilactobacillus ruminis (strain ATCC 27782 / RF3) TaxID=1069534 RepID=G2SMC5_LIGR2|nr:Hypothetical protein LRC_18070 [Ligilactobacillus ruminis ATCC 27782]